MRKGVAVLQGRVARALQSVSALFVLAEDTSPRRVAAAVAAAVAAPRLSWPFRPVEPQGVGRIPLGKYILGDADKRPTTSRK